MNPAQIYALINLLKNIYLREALKVDFFYKTFFFATVYSFAFFVFK